MVNRDRLHGRVPTIKELSDKLDMVSPKPKARAKARSVIDRHARTKVDGITRRLDKIESLLQNGIYGNAALSKRITDTYQKALAEIRKPAPVPSATERTAIRKAHEALHKIAAMPCGCAAMYTRGQIEHQTITFPTPGGTHHWLGCHVAIAAQGLG